MDTPQDQQKTSPESGERQWSQAVEEGARGVLQRLRVPRRDQLQEAQQRLERLAERIAALEGESAA